MNGLRSNRNYYTIYLKSRQQHEVCAIAEFYISFPFFPLRDFFYRGIARTLAAYQNISHMKKEKEQSETKVCTKCNTEKPIEDFRTHKSGFSLNQCRSCEKEIALARARAKKGNPIPAATTPSTFTITTKKGKEFQASLEPIPKGRKATMGENTLYFHAGTTRDEARSAFSAHFLCSMTGIATEVVE
jgi:hypothetical protein